MIRKIVRFSKALLKMPFIVYYSRRELQALNAKLDDHKILMGKLFAVINKIRTEEIIKNIHLSEFKVFSQWGDDGIIQFLIDYLDIENQIFIEFGVENYKEANTRFLLINNNWRGLVMDGSLNNMQQLQNENIYWKYDIKALPLFVTKENINSVIEENGFSGQLGLLHIDIDGNDYWVWKEINNISPVIVIVEYNSIFGCQNPWTVPYDKDFYRTSYHYSNLYWGVSLLSLCDLAQGKGYYFIGSNSNGNNAYFVRKDKMKDLKPLSAAEGYILSKYRESRDVKGKLTYLAGTDRLKEIKGMEIFNTRTGKLEKI
jgi:hypothetical protein